MRTYEELIATQTELVHFNPNHDPKNGQFTKSSVKSTTKKAVGTAAVIGSAFAAERFISNKLRYGEATNKALLKSSAISFGRAAVASALAVIGNDLVESYKNNDSKKR